MLPEARSGSVDERLADIVVPAAIAPVHVHAKPCQRDNVKEPKRKTYCRRVDDVIQQDRHRHTCRHYNGGECGQLDGHALHDVMERNLAELERQRVTSVAQPGSAVPRDATPGRSCRDGFDEREPDP